MELVDYLRGHRANRWTLHKWSGIEDACSKGSFGRKMLRNERLRLKHRENGICCISSKRALLFWTSNHLLINIIISKTFRLACVIVYAQSEKTHQIQGVFDFSVLL